MSGILYTAYVNEINCLHKIMGTQMYKNITGKNNSENNKIIHNAIIFVDDNTNIISGKNYIKINSYLNDFYFLLQKFYNSNKLKINPDKTEILVTCKQRLCTDTDKITFNADGYKVLQSDHVKILGYIIQKNLQNDKQINNMIKNCYFKLHNLYQIKHLINFKTRLQLANSIVIDIINYGLPILLISEPKILKKTKWSNCQNC